VTILFWVRPTRLAASRAAHGFSFFPEFRKEKHAENEYTLGEEFPSFARVFGGSVTLDLAWRVIMEKMQGTAHLLRKIALLTLLGFLVIFLAGPIFAVIFTILPFALIGFLVWAPFQMFVFRKEIHWPAFDRAGERVRRAVLAVPRGLAAAGKQVVRTVFAVPLWIGRQIFRGVWFVLRTVFAVIGFILRLLMPTLAGAVLGAMLGVMGGLLHDTMDVEMGFRVVEGAFIGATVGLLAAIAWPRAGKTMTAPATGAFRQA
jgi:hypothetical protein